MHLEACTCFCICFPTLTVNGMVNHSHDHSFSDADIHAVADCMLALWYHILLVLWCPCSHHIKVQQLMFCAFHNKDSEHQTVSFLYLFVIEFVPHWWSCQESLCFELRESFWTFGHLWKLSICANFLEFGKLSNFWTIVHITLCVRVSFLEGATNSLALPLSKAETFWVF